MTRSKPIWLQVLELPMPESELRCRKPKVSMSAQHPTTFRRRGKGINRDSNLVIEELPCMPDFIRILF
jgi:hypothetical protein